MSGAGFPPQRARVVECLPKSAGERARVFSWNFPTFATLALVGWALTLLEIKQNDMERSLQTAHAKYSVENEKINSRASSSLSGPHFLDPFSYHIDIDSVWRFIVPHTEKGRSIVGGRR